ncbi:MAG: ThiF family adenylyltransferase [Gammaproteobacteria bacterium]|nr:ThiF family adenylyltransferase [Gammaproteobacteria bacterium]
MPDHILSVAIPAATVLRMFEHLIRADKEEDLLFALWYPSQGVTRYTALIHTPVFPQPGDRQRHGNASFNPQYLERVCAFAMQTNAGVAFIHSHPVPGWQDMSLDDIVAEQKMAGAVSSLTDMPLVGMTVGTDGTWSARFWEHIKGKQFQRIWCHSVRSIGKQLNVSFNDSLMPKPEYRTEFKRTITVWGKQNHARLARLKVGIIGLGSVGSFVAEQLSRMGFENLSLIDFDTIKFHNLDRTLFATKEDIGKHKVTVIKEMVHKSSTAKQIYVDCIPYSIAEEVGYLAALDCDILFSCVDRPRARRILNHFAYAHLIPVIDGGIQVRFKEQIFTGVDWQLQTISPDRPCFECLGVYNNADVATEIEGKLDDLSYIKGLPATHRFRRNENVIPFSANLASLEVLQLIALVTGIAGVDDFGVQRYRYNPGIVERNVERTCIDGCAHVSLTARGDKDFTLYGQCKAAEKTRREVNKIGV